MPPDNSHSSSGGSAGETGAQGETGPDGVPRANQRPLFTHFVLSIRPAHSTAQKASANAIRNLVRVPSKDIEEGDINCAICYEPMEDYDGPDDASTETMAGEPAGESGPGREAGPEPAPEPAPEPTQGEQSEPAGEQQENAPPSPVLNPDDHSGAALPCKHVFGRSCLHSWLKKAPSCPICRARVESEAGEDDSSFHLMDLNFDVIFPEPDMAPADMRELLNGHRATGFPGGAVRFARREGEEAPLSAREPADAPEAAEARQMEARLARLREAWEGRTGDDGAVANYMDVFLRTEASLRVATLRQRLQVNRRRQMAAQDLQQREAQMGTYWSIFTRLMNHRRNQDEAPAPAAPAPSAVPTAPAPAPAPTAPAPAPAPTAPAQDTDTQMSEHTPRRQGPRRRDQPRRTPYSR